jgi:SAM-dependent methyltransferase
MKLHIGAGHNIFPGWVNHDLVALPGVDTVHDLRVFPWPWADGSFDEVIAKDVFEHLPDLIRTMEELHRICKPGAKVHLSVPYWNSFEAVTDPTHVRQFNEFTFEFFDPTKKRCQRRPYYSTARFEIERLGFGITPCAPYLVIPFFTRYIVVYTTPLKKLLGVLASYLSNVIIGLEVHLVRR